MKLYGKPGACSLAAHIALQETALAGDYVTVDLATKKLADGSDYLLINPKGQVPALALDNGFVLTEVAAIMQYLADRNPAAGLLPAASELERYQVIGWLNFAATELHKNFGPFFRPNTPDAYKDILKQTLEAKLTLLDEQLATQDYVVSSGYSLADIYIFVTLNWARFAGINLGDYRNLGAYSARIASRPAVQAALQAEGLLK